VRRLYGAGLRYCGSTKPMGETKRDRRRGSGCDELPPSEIERSEIRQVRASMTITHGELLV
jgi:hypothetical protein